MGDLFGSVTRVVSMKYAPADWKTNPDFVYIGRPGKGSAGYFGNPYHVDIFGEKALTFFDSYLERRVAEDRSFREAVLGLRGKTLV